MKEIKFNCPVDIGDYCYEIYNNGDTHRRATIYTIREWVVCGIQLYTDKFEHSTEVLIHLTDSQHSTNSVNANKFGTHFFTSFEDADKVRKARKTNKEVSGISYE